MNQPMKRKPGRPRKYPLPATKPPTYAEQGLHVAQQGEGVVWGENLNQHLELTHADDTRGEERPATGAEGVSEGTSGLLGGVEKADARAALGVLAAEADIEPDNEVVDSALLGDLTHDQDEEHAVADEAERADSGAGEDLRSEPVRSDLDEAGRTPDGPSGLETASLTQDRVSLIQGHELAAMKEEAWEGFNYREGRGKMDTLGRIWEFVPETRQGMTVVTFSMRRPCGPRQERTISTANYGTDTARAQSDAMVDEMNGWAL
jgi:hypothetical protein